MPVFRTRIAALAGSSDVNLVKRFILKRGEDEFRILYRRHAPRMREVSRRLLGDLGTGPDDVVQEAWLRAVRALATFEQRSSLHSWLIGIVVNVARETRRRAGTGPIYMAETPETSASHRDPLASLEMERAVETLPAGYRTVLMLHDVGGFTHAEIGGMLDIDEGTSKSQLARARQRLRDRLKPRPEASP
jgi:RNA polymerase sigma-70 factor (ECF subfamily)